MRRVIRPCPTTSAEAVPDGAVVVDGRFDYIDDGSSAQPADALYVAVDGVPVLDTFDPVRYVPRMQGGKPVLDADGNPILDLAPNCHAHAFAGWHIPGDPVTVAEPTP